MALHKRVLLERFTQSTEDLHLRSLERTVDLRLNAEYAPGREMRIDFWRRLNDAERAHLANLYRGKEWDVRFQFSENATVMMLK